MLFVTPIYAQVRGVVVSENAIAYEAPSFDSKMIGSVKLGAQFLMSEKLYGGAFYKVQVQKGRFAYVADTDIRPLDSKGEPIPLESTTKKPKKTEVAPVTQEESKKPNKPQLPFAFTQYGGVSIQQVGYKEGTMGATPTANLNFVGIKLTGPDLVVEGMFVTEMNFNFYLNAPDYYSSATNRPASGHIMLADFQFMTVGPRGPDVLTFYGFGPLLRWSKYNLQLDYGAGDFRSYQAEDLALGAIFSLGGALRLGPMALRGELRYHWEQKQYFGFGLAVQGAF